MNKIIIPLDNGYKLVAEQNTDSQFNKELFVGIETDTGAYIQDLAVIRPTYSFEGESVKFNSDNFELLIFGDEKVDDYTDKFVVPLLEENE